MTEQQVAAFLRQFKEAEVAKWPQWMQRAARYASASLPK